MLSVDSSSCSPSLAVGFGLKTDCQTYKNNVKVILYFLCHLNSKTYLLVVFLSLHHSTTAAPQHTAMKHSELITAPIPVGLTVKDDKMRMVQFTDKSVREQLWSLD